MSQFNFIVAYQLLEKGDSLMSKDGSHKAIFQEDGNFVIYKWTPCWHTNTANDGGVKVVMQADNNLVMYTEEQKAVWSSVTWSEDSTHLMRLTMKDEGHLVIEKAGEPIWSSENSEGRKE